MTDEKKKPEADEVSDEQLEGVAGGTAAIAGVSGTGSTSEYSQEMAGAKPGEVRGFVDPDGSTSYTLKSDGQTEPKPFASKLKILP